MILLRKVKINGFKKYISCCFFKCRNYSALGFIFAPDPHQVKEAQLEKEKNELIQK